MSKNSYSKFLIFSLLMLSSFGAIFAISPFKNTDDRLNQLSERLEALSPVTLDTIPGSGNARVLANVIIPIRQGFPFCETFIGFDPRPNAIWNVAWAPGQNNINALTGTSLQLTSLGGDENGYVFVDIPFSAAFGLKVSFEFSNYGGTGADGVSFFMFDGSISAADFDIGGTGGALGYTAVRATANESTLISPGLKGAYLGIGFDELGNFGNSRTGKYGGFEDPNNLDALGNTPLFPHSVIVRGPVDGPPPLAPTTLFRDWDRINDSKNIPTTITNPRYESYKFIDGRIFDPASTGIAATNPPVSVASFLHPDERFEIDTDSFSDNCLDEGFRKVFLDLNPVDVNNPSLGYTIEIQMLINVGGVVKLVNVFNGPINYPYAAPKLLKVGFAASTGLQTNFHNIRNVTVQVSDENNLEKPVVEPLIKEVCEGAINIFDLDVELRNDIGNAFIRCLQLYDEPQDALDVVAANGISIPFPESTPQSSPNTYCPTGNCVDLLCVQARTSKEAFDDVTGVPAGDFEVFLIDSAGIEVPKVRFTPKLGYSGVTTVWYTAADNFGQVSDPKPITITINPNPEPIITTSDPLVWEQSEINDISVLWNSGVTGTGYTYSWFKDTNPIPGADETTYLATEPGDYSVKVTTGNGCVGFSANAITIRIVADLNPDLTKTRENCVELGTIKVTLDYAPVSAGSSDGEKWRIVDNAGNVVVNWRFFNIGQDIINYPGPGDPGLPAGAYVFQIGDKFRSNLSIPPRYRQLLSFTILPIANPLKISSVTTAPELCFGEGGTITVDGDGGDGAANYVFIATNTGTSISYNPTSVTGSQAIFNDMPKGNYIIDLTGGPLCQVTDTALVTGPSSPLSINLTDSGGTSCSVATSAFATWMVMGGTPGYTFVSLTRDGASFPSASLNQTPAGVFAFTNLTVGEYVLTVKDANGCETSSLPLTLNNIPPPDFEVSDAVACEGEVAILQPILLDISNSVPVFTWKTPQGDVIANGATISGVTYTISDHDSNPSTPDRLSISGLSAGTFPYVLSISGTNTCNFPDLIATVTVSKYPPVEDVLVTNLDCFEDNSGALEVVMDAGVVFTDFSYEIVGVRPVQDSPIFIGLPEGTYQIRVTNKVTSCITLRNNVSITQPDKLAVQNVLPIDPTCGASNGSVKFEIAGGTKDYSVILNNLPISDYSNSLTSGIYEVKNLAPGTYSFEILDANGCPLNLPNAFTLTNNTGFNVVLNPMKDEVCLGQELVLSPVFTSPVPVTPVLKWYKDAALSQPIASSSTPDLDGITYQINPANGTLTIGGQSTGSINYYLEISGPGICTVVEIADTEVFPELTALITPTKITCFGDTDGAITIVPSGGNGIFEISLNNSPFTSNLTYTNLAPGSYKIDLRNDIGCTFTQTVVVESPTAPLSINTPTIVRASCKLNNGAIKDLVISGGWGSYTVEWRKGSATGPKVPGDENSAGNLLPDDYFLLVTDLNGCPAIFNFPVEESSDPVYAIVPPINSCTGDAVAIRPVHLAPDPSLPPAAATEVRWYTDPGQTGLIQDGADPVLPGVTYTIDDTDWLNPELVVEGLTAGTYDFYFYVVCTGQEIPVSITIFDTPAVVLDPTPITCFGNTNGKISILSGALPEYTYSVNGAAPINQLAFESLNLAAGTYPLVVATPAGCAQTTSFTIAGPSAKLESSTLTKIHPGCGASNGKLELVVTGGWLPFTLDVIKDGVSQGSQEFNVSNILLDGYRPGDYQIIITDKEGCSVTTNLVTLVDGPTQVLAGRDDICVGSEATLVPKLDLVAAGATFDWFFDAASSQPITSSPSPAADGIIYQINSTTGELTIENLPASATDYMYYVTASGTGVCPGFIGTGKVRVFDKPTAIAVPTNEICYDDGGTITVNATGGSGAYTYSLDGGAFGTSNVFQVPRGTYEVVVQTPQGCGFTVSNIVVAGPAAALGVTDVQMDSPSCALNNGEIRFNVAGGYPPYTISYTKDKVAAGTINLAVPGIATISNLGEGSYLFQVTDDSGCVISLPNTLTLVEIPTVITAPDQVICEGETANLNATLPQNILNPTYVWSFDAAGNNVISSSTANGVTYTLNSGGAMSVDGLLASGSSYTYYVMASGLGICGLSPKPVTVKVNSIPELRVSNPAIVCDPTGRVDLTQWIEGFNPTVYDYSVVSPSGSALRLSELNAVSTSGTYHISSSMKGTGCFGKSEKMLVRISVTQLVADFQYVADFGGGILLPNAEIQIQENVNFEDLSLGDVLIWDWDFGDGSFSPEQNPTHQYQNKGTYTVTLTATDTFGCVSVYQIVVQVLDDYLIMIPNAFTPIGAKNQYFKPVYRGITSMEFYIFSTWGELIYQSTQLDGIGWDGTVNGKEATNGNYVYKGIFKTKSGEEVEKAGTFVLIR